MATVMMAPIKHHSFASGQRKRIQAGYKVTLCEKVEERYKCPLCCQLMRDPVQTYRGVLACASCYEQAKREDGICPVDGETIESDEVFRDKAKGREILVLDCYCTYQNDGCVWKGKVNDVENHEESCPHRPQKCHFCNEDVKTSMVKTHLGTCDKWSLDKRCLYSACPYTPTNITDLKAHLREEVLSHAIMHTSTVERLQNEFHCQQEIWQERGSQMENNVEELKSQITLLMTYTTDLQNKYDSKTKKLEDRINQLEADKLNQSKEDTHEEAVSTNVKEMRDAVTAIKTNLSDLNLRQQLFENTSFNGNLLWKIDNISQRMQKAKTGSITALHSAPVFTAPYGYKFCARLYLNGDGIGKCSHASLFFVMMKGEYDNVLEWPFNREIKFRLINQNNCEDDAAENFRPDPKSSSFMKPKKDMNVASGCPLFVTQEKLLSGGFIKDDTLFVQVSVV